MAKTIEDWRRDFTVKTEAPHPLAGRRAIVELKGGDRYVNVLVAGVAGGLVGFGIADEDTTWVPIGDVKSIDVLKR